MSIAVWGGTVTDHLGRCFICLGDGKTQEFLFHPLYKRCEIAVSTLDDPVRHGLSGNVYAIPLEFLLYTVECRRIHILHIQNGSKQGRGHNAVAQQVFRAVPSHKFILMVAICPDIHLNGMDFHCPGFRLVPQSFIDFIRHPAPAAFPILDSDHLGINYDPSHFIWQMIDYIRPLYEFKDKIFHVHYKDIKIYKDKLESCGTMAYPLEYMSPKIPGLGDVDWGKYVSALTDIGYDGYTCIEIEDKAFEDSKEKVENSLILSKRYLEQFVI